MLAKDTVLEYMLTQSQSHSNEIQFTTQELSEALQMQRSNLSKLLNELVKEQRIKKTNSRPVYYSIVTNEDSSCFNTMVGFKSSLKQVVQLTKAALLYPGNPLPILITGPDGSGKSLLASLVYEFAKESKILAQDAPFVKINCRYLEQETEERIKEVFFSGEDGAIHRAQNGVLFVDHINCLCHDVQNILLKQAEQVQTSSGHSVLIYSVDDSVNPSYLNLYTSKFSIIVDMPPLSKRPIEERFEMVQLFFQNEAQHMQKEIKINAELLRCLLLYPCQCNVKQLHKDIQLACANGYARNFDTHMNQMEILIHDFPNYVRKGFLYYRKYRTQLESLVSDNYQYIFSAKTTNACESSTAVQKNARDNFYDKINHRIEELKERGMAEEDITTIIQSDHDYSLYKTNHSMFQKEINKESLSKIVDQKIIQAVDRFLKEASLRFNRVYSDSVFYAICLHLSSMLERQNKSQKISNEQIVSIVKECNDEYIFCTKFANELAKEYHLQSPIPIDEIVFLTRFICDDPFSEVTESKPVVLVAMHGNSTASSIVEVANALVQDDNLFSFDLRLDIDMQQIYENFKQTILDINQGKGVLMLYDMGSLQSMAGMVTTETGIPIKTVCIPATLIALDASRKASCQDSLDEVYHEVVDSYQQMYPELERSLQKAKEPQVIITLCMTGEGAAVQMKKYIEQNIHLENTDILPLSISDREYLLKKVNQIQKKQKIVCIIGVYNPELYGIPYIPVSTLFNTPADKLDILLTLETTHAVTAVNYDAIYAYLQEQLDGFDIQLLKDVLPKVMVRIKKACHGLSSDQELGLFMHIACSIYHLQQQKSCPPNGQAQRIISKSKRMYHDLKDFLAPVEDAFDVQFNDDEIANIIQIIKKC